MCLCVTHSKFHGVPNLLRTVTHTARSRRRHGLSVVSGPPFFTIFFFFHFTLTPIYLHKCYIIIQTLDDNPAVECVWGFALNVWTQNRRWFASLGPWNVRGSHTVTRIRVFVLLLSMSCIVVTHILRFLFFPNRLPSVELLAGPF